MPKQAAEPPDIRTQHGRLRWAREKANFPSIRAAAKEFGWNENTYKSHEQGIRQREGLKERHARKYAKAFKVSLRWLVTGEGDPLKDFSELDALTPEERVLALRLLRATQSAEPA